MLKSMSDQIIRNTQDEDWDIHPDYDVMFLVLQNATKLFLWITCC